MEQCLGMAVAGTLAESDVWDFLTRLDSTAGCPLGTGLEIVGGGDRADGLYVQDADQEYSIADGYSKEDFAVRWDQHPQPAARKRAGSRGEKAWKKPAWSTRA